MSKKTYTIFQKLLQTDYYTVEANSAEEALKFYKENIGEVMSNGSTGGWAFSDSISVVAVCDNNPEDVEISEKISRAKQRRKKQRSSKSEN
jgi:hypothetical protein